MHGTTGSTWAGAAGRMNEGGEHHEAHESSEHAEVHIVLCRPDRGRIAAPDLFDDQPSPGMANAERASVRRSEDSPDESATFETVPLMPKSAAAMRTMA